MWHDADPPTAGPLHLVQLGSDDAVFARGYSEPVARQVRYGGLLDEMRPGSRVTCLVLTRRGDAAARREDNVSFVPVLAARGGLRKIRLWRELARTLSDLHAGRPINVVTTQTVHDEAWVALHFGARHGVPVVGQIHFDLFSPHALAEMSRNRLTARVRRAVTLARLPRFRALRVVGARIGRTITSRGLHGNVHVLPVAVSMAATEPPAVGGPRELRVLFVGRLCQQKNLGLWLEVARRVTQRQAAVRFDLVGEGDLRGPLEAEARRQGLHDRVDFHGFVPYEQLGALYRRASVFLLTSHFEGFGRVLVEALAHHLPVVAPRIAGPEDIVVDGESGYLVEPGDAEGCAERIVAVLGDASLGGPARFLRRARRALPVRPPSGWRAAGWNYW